MSLINDEEDLLEAVQAHVMANLNTSIAEINTEKNDDIRIDSISASSDNYVFAGDLLDLPNHPFVNFAIEDIKVSNNHNDKITTVNLMIEVVIDNAKKQSSYWKSLRYMRALYETLLSLEASTLEVDEIRMTKLMPMIAGNNQRQMIISGVGISVTIG